MVRIKELKEDRRSSEEEVDEEGHESEESDENASDPAVPEASSALEPTAFEDNPEVSSPESATVSPRSLSHNSGVTPPVLSFTVNHRYLRYLLGKCNGSSINMNRSIVDRPATAQAVPGSSFVRSHVTNDLPQFTCTDPRTPVENSTVGNTVTEHVTKNVTDTESSCSLFVNEVLSKNKIVEDDLSKSDSDGGSTKEKSDGLSEKEQVAAAATVTSSPLSSPQQSDDDELSTVSDGLAPPDYDFLHNCPYSDAMNSNGDEIVNPDLTESAGKGHSEAKDGGEAAALPVSASTKDSWESWVPDDRLFTLETDAPAPSTSSAADDTDRIPSPETERRRIKQENRLRARERSMGKYISRFIFVPTEKVGRIVGKGGRRIKEIEKQTGAKIKIESRKSSEPVTQISLAGTEEQISAAEEEICKIARNFKAPKSGEPTAASVSSVDEIELRQMLSNIKDQVLDGEKHCREP